MWRVISDSEECAKVVGLAASLALKMARKDEDWLVMMEPEDGVILTEVWERGVEEEPEEVEAEDLVWGMEGPCAWTTGEEAPDWGETITELPSWALSVFVATVIEVMRKVGASLVEPDEGEQPDVVMHFDLEGKVVLAPSAPVEMREMEYQEAIERFDNGEL